MERHIVSIYDCFRRYFIGFLIRNMVTRSYRLYLNDFDCYTRFIHLITDQAVVLKYKCLTRKTNEESTVAGTIGQRSFEYRDIINKLIFVRCACEISPPTLLGRDSGRRLGSLKTSFSPFTNTIYFMLILNFTNIFNAIRLQYQYIKIHNLSKINYQRFPTDTIHCGVTRVQTISKCAVLQQRDMTRDVLFMFSRLILVIGVWREHILLRTTRTTWPNLTV